MLGYGKDSHTYKVFSNVLHKVVETVDVRFDETNGLQRRSMSLALRMSNSSRITYAEPVKLER